MLRSSLNLFRYKSKNRFRNFCSFRSNFSVESFLEKNNIQYTIKNDKFVLKYCPTCPPHKDKFNNFYKLYVWDSNGGFFCHRCEQKGNFNQLKTNLFSNLDNFPTQNPQQKTLPQNPLNTESIADLNNIFTEGLQNFEKNMGDVQAKILLSRGLKSNTLKKFKVGVIQWNFANLISLCVFFPWFHRQNCGENKCDLVRVKFRSLQTKSHQSMFPYGKIYGLFGLNLIEPDDKVIVITEGEYDAMAVYQETDYKAISLPNGAHCFKHEIYKTYFKQFEKIYIWTDFDQIGQSVSEEIATFLGPERCFLVKKPTGINFEGKDANDFLLKGKNLTEIINNAKRVENKYVFDYKKIKEEILDEIDRPDYLRGTKLITIPELNKFYRHRKGEFSIFTGSTGIGKTTFLSQLSLDLAIQGTKTLWGSFEIMPKRLAATMLRQLNGEEISTLSPNFNQIFSCFKNLPLHFLNFHGATQIAELYSALIYSIDVLKVEHIIIDNLQFMIGFSTAFDKFDKQDKLIEMIRNLVTERNIHVTVVIHPRKEALYKLIDISSIFGTAKATQEADNIFMIDKNPHGKFVKMLKNRFTGDLGILKVNFDKEAKLFDVDQDEFNEFGFSVKGIYETFQNLQKK